MMSEQWGVGSGTGEGMAADASASGSGDDWCAFFARGPRGCSAIVTVPSAAAGVVQDILDKHIAALVNCGQLKGRGRRKVDPCQT